MTGVYIHPLLEILLRKLLKMPLVAASTMDRDFSAGCRI